MSERIRSACVAMPELVPDEAETPTFPEVYDACARLAWCAVVRLGVPDHAAEDAVQDVFLVVHRRLADFRGESTLRTWVYGIAVRVARNYRRGLRRRDVRTESSERPSQMERIAESIDCAPDALLARSEAARVLSRVLDELDDDLREVFVLAELEEMTAVEIAAILGTNSNTVSSRLRMARRAFERSVARARARDEWRIR
jgi:RNA polymerase sigma-70 factor (ECF subfamily)